MRKRWLNISAGLTAAAVMGLGCPVMAAETAEEIILEAGGEKIAIVNDTGLEIVSAGVQEAGAEEETVSADEAGTDGTASADEAGTDGTASADEAGTDGAASADETGTGALSDASCTVVLSEAGSDHIFEDAEPAVWTDAKLVEEQGFLYIRYTDAEGSQRELAETADAVEPEGGLTMWAVTDVYVREAADGESEVLAVAGLGDECSVVSILPGWYQVEYKEVTGYISHRFLTDDEEEAKAAADQEQAARDAAAAANSYSFSGNGGGGSHSSGGKKNKTSGGKKEEACLENGLLN